MSFIKTNRTELLSAHPYDFISADQMSKLYQLAERKLNIKLKMNDAEV